MSVVPSVAGRVTGAGAALYPCEIVHVRTEPVRNRFRYRGYLWLVDLDDLPRVPLLARFRACDHLGDPGRPIWQNVEAYLAVHGIDLGGGQVLMLAAARVLGHVFNPLSVYWCHDASGALVCVVAEVHNTYGQRHCYLLRTDARGRAGTGKEFYVSPFEKVEGEYRMSLPEPGERLDLTITLHREGRPPFTASVRGRRRAATPRAVLATALRHPLAPLVVSLRIRRQGLALRFRGLRFVPRPEHERQEAVG